MRRSTKVSGSAFAPLLVFLGTGGALVGGCGDPFSSCEAHRSCPTTGGSGGSSVDDAGSAGVGEAGGTQNGAGGATEATGGGPTGAGSGATPGSGGGNVGEDGDSGSGSEVAGGVGGRVGTGAGDSGGTGGYNGGAAGAGGSAGDSCDPNPCANSGICSEAVGEAICDCGSRYVGKTCQLLRFRGIGALAGAATSELVAVSGDGNAVVGNSPLGVGSRPFRSVAGAALQQIPSPSGVTGSCKVKGTNRTGATVVGNCDDASFRFAVGAGSTLLDLAPAAASIAYAVSADGSTVVGEGLSPKFEAFRWTSSGVSFLGKLQSNPNSDSYAVAASLDGSVLVGVDDSVNSRKVAWRWKLSSGMAQLPALSGWDYYLATDVSADGEVVVGWAAVGTQSRALQWVGTGVPTYLGTGTSAVPVAANFDGSVVVGENAGRAVVWDSSGEHDVVSLLGATPDLSGWTLTGVADIADDGKTLVGTGIHNGNAEGWIAHLP